MTKSLALNQVTLCADGSIGLQWLKQVVDPTTGEVLMSEPHRTVVEFDGNVADQVGAVSNHLVEMGYPPVTDDMLALVVKVDRLARADAGVSARRAAKIGQRKQAAR